MRFVELAIEAFQALESARVVLGPGLNVLYGPNDLGKSTLAGAIRAALLVPPKGSEANSFSSWYADATPRVTLTFTDDQDHLWQIKKAFGSGASAELLHSKDGQHFSIDCKAREVEEKLRGLLQWGIAAPGGKGAPRGLPDSFLAKVLLAAQTDVDDILAASLEKDQVDSGKLKLRKALATLAQDPLFKRVLDAAKEEFDVYFTATGRPRRTEGSKLVEADRAVKKHQAEHDRLRQEREQSREIEQQVGRLHEACASAEQAVHDAELAFTTARAGLVNGERRAQAQQQLMAAERALAEIDAQAARVQGLEQEQQRLGVQLQEQRRALEQTTAEVERLTLAQRAAETELERASSDAAEQTRKLREAELEREASELRERRSQLESRRDDASRASAAAEAQEAAARELAKGAQKALACAEQLKGAQDGFDAAEQECDLARRVLAYGRWRAAEAVVQQSAQLRQEQETLTQKATTSEADAAVLREQYERLEAELAERRSKLPTREHFKQLDTLRQALERAEAALGGGLSIRVTPRRAELKLRALIDRAQVGNTELLTGEQTFEAERSARLQIEDLVEIEISAGAAEKRREVAALRQRWTAEVVPVLENAAAASLASIEGALVTFQEDDKAALVLRQQAESRAGDARATRERATLIGKQLDAQPTHDVAGRRAAIGSISLDLLEPRWRKLGSAWEASAERESERAKQLRETARSRCDQLKHEHVTVDQQQREAENRLRERTEQAAELASMLQGRGPRELMTELASELTVLTKRQLDNETTRNALAEQAGAQRVHAERALAQAKAACERAQANCKEKQSAVARAQSQLDTVIGSTRVEQERLASLDRAAAQGQMQLCAAQLEGCPREPIASENDVAAAEAAHTRAQHALTEQREDLHKTEGALTRVGGAQLLDRLQQEQEALDTARAREHALQVDADAWKLLREALTQAETEESDHLGVALGRPVGEKLRELTGGRYSELSFDQHMTATRLKAEGATPDADVLDGLSVGTRNQLATLVRLTIASQLKSAIILDDHLVHTDPARLGWFRDVLRRTALDTQVLVLTCRPEDYLERSELPMDAALQDLAGGTVRAIDLTRALRRWPARG